MSTITSPRSTSIPPAYRNSNLTPTTSTRPSIDTPQSYRSTSPSPSRLPARRNRAALRSYYNLQQPTTTTSETASTISASTPTSPIYTSSESDVAPSPLDSPTFDAPAHISHLLSTLPLADLLRSYNMLLSDIRALDAEKKALVYDNYSKLISATETISRMRGNMEPGSPGVGTLDVVVGKIWERVDEIREEIGGAVGGDAEKRRTVKAVREIVEVPDRVRGLLREGKEEEGKVLWEETLVVLRGWLESGKGGKDVQICIDDGEAALKGEEPIEGSWSRVKTQPDST